MQAQLEIWSSNSFTLGWQGNDRHSCKGASPSLSLPYTLHLNSYPVKHKYFQWLLCKKNLVLSTTHQMIPHRSRRICIPDTLTMQQHEETSCSILDTKPPPFPILFLYCMHSKITLRCSFTARKQCHSWMLMATCILKTAQHSFIPRFMVLIYQHIEMNLNTTISKFGVDFSYCWLNLEEQL